MYSYLMKEEGFSLVEVMAAVAMAGILIIPIFSMFAGSTASILFCRQETEAVTLAQDKMETLKGLGYTALRDHLQGEGEKHWQETTEDYSRKVAVKSIPLADLFPGTEGELIILEVLVSWGELENPHTVSLISYLGEGCAVKTDSENENEG